MKNVIPSNIISFWIDLVISFHPIFVPLESSSSIVALESVDSLVTWDPSLFFDIKFLLLKFLETNIVVKMAPYEYAINVIPFENICELSRKAGKKMYWSKIVTHFEFSASIEFLQAINRFLSVYHGCNTFSLLKLS